MKPTEILSAEHRVIEQVLDCLERMAQGAESGHLKLVDARSALDFLRACSDRSHLGKAERDPFPTPMEPCFPRRAGPLAVMLAEHDLGREGVRAMATALDGCERGSRAALASFVREARAFVEF